MSRRIRYAEEDLMDMYKSGKTIKEIAAETSISVGKVYGILKDAGCVFRPGRYPKGRKMNPDSIAASVKKRRENGAFEWSEERRRKASDAKRSKYNGMNGHGHTKRHNSGYIIAHAPEHPRATKDGFVMQHTIVLEQHIGRYLRANEVAHHINHVRDDNRIENLLLMDRKEHQAMHSRKYHKARRDSQ